MAFHVVHAQRRNLPGKRQRLGARSAHQQGTDQARACGIGNGVNVLSRTPSLLQHLADQRQHAFDVIARGQFRHYAAVGTVQINLTEQRIGQQTALTVV